MLELSGALMAMTLAVFAVYGLFAASVRDRDISRPKVMAWLRRCFAAGFAALGARRAFAERWIALHRRPGERRDLYAAAVIVLAEWRGLIQSRATVIMGPIRRNDG
jgi:hypothetical protein